MTPYIIGQSKAIFGTWFYFPMYNLMFDCGDSAAYGLGVHTADIKYIFISHFHKDHYLGLIGIGTFLNRVTRKVKRKIKVYYHENNEKEIKELKKALEGFDVKDVFEFISFNFKDDIEIDGKKFIKAFEVEHSAKYYRKKITACGFKIFEKRKNIKEEYRGELDKIKSNIEKAKYIKKIQIKDKNIYKTSEHIFVSYCGDSYPGDLDSIEETEILMHECTFLTEAELDAAHTDLENLVKKLKKINIDKFNKLILYHLSEKYIREEKNYKEIILNKLKKIDVDVDIVEINKTYRLYK